MATNTEKITSLEKVTLVHGTEIEELKKNYEESKLILTEIMKKLDKLLLLEEQSDEKFKYRKLTCQKIFDDRYIMKAEFRPIVVEILQSIRKDDLQITKNKTNIVDSVFNIAWKLGSVLAVLYLVVDKILQ